jgi:hypothetical protein
MTTKLCGLALALALVTPLADAATGFRTALVEEVQLDSHIRVGYQDAVWIKFSGSWAAAGTTCGADWVWFDGKEDPHFLATVLTARTTGTQLRIYVDDSLPKLGAACHIMTMMLMTP